jgi:YesN/AraC family two-component response regulator
MKNEEGQKIVLAATEEFGYAKEALLFGVDIVTKIDKS